ncbi:MAG: hypothetical protein GY830_00410 [Bacteroidetes bacterium]|nr:hypothetical protein [Bacteroidota bacterium]
MQADLLSTEKQIFKKFIKKLKDQGYDAIVHVPCSILDTFIKYCKKENMKIITATDEGEAVAMIVGIYLAGSKSILCLSNAGIGNIINPIATLVNVFKIPIFMIMSFRGCTENDPPQHKFSGNITKDFLKKLNINTYEFPESKEKLNKINLKVENINKSKEIVCLLLKQKCKKDFHINEKRINLFIEKKQVRDSKEKLGLKVIDLRKGTKISRYETIRCFVKNLSKETVSGRTKIIDEKGIKQSRIFSKDVAFISTTGLTSRDLYKINHSSQNFYMVGSLGYASAIGLGVALYSSKKIVIFDGDGALLMKLGNLATIGHYSPKNLIHIVLNNTISESTGGQKLSSQNINFAEIALNCNYRHCIITDNNIQNTLEFIKYKEGPIFIECKINIDSKKLSPRLFLDFPNIGQNFYNFLNHFKL